MRKYIDIPIGVGFGINNAESARKIGAVADAVIVGSRIVKEIESHAGSEAEADCDDYISGRLRCFASTRLNKPLPNKTDICATGLQGRWTNCFGF